MRLFTQTVQCATNTEAIVRSLPGLGRKYLLIENRSGNEIYVNFGTHADSTNGISIGSGGSYELDRVVSNDPVYIQGSVAATQNINITQGYDDA